MKISGILLKQALEFLNQSRSSSQNYSKFVELRFDYEGMIQTKVCGDVIVASSCTYFDHEYKTSDSENKGIGYCVVPIERLLKYLKHNAGAITVKVESNALVLTGSGNLKLAFASPDEYELCEFESILYDPENWVAGAHITIKDEKQIEGLVDKFKSLSKWADTTTSSPIFRNIFFSDGKASARLYKTNTSVLDVSLGIPIACYALVDTTFLQILSRLKGVQKLALVIPKEESEGNLTGFCAINPDIPMTYVCVGRLMTGTHPIKEINQTIAQIVKQGQYFECSRLSLLNLVQRSLGYVDGVQVGIFTFQDCQLNLLIKQANDQYEDMMTVESNHLNTFFRLNLQALERILVDIDDETIKIYAHQEGSQITKFAIITSNENKRGYLFPAV